MSDLIGFDDDLVDRARALGTGRTAMLGIAGPPGAGKSTLANWLVERLDPRGSGEVVAVPMDGFHLADVTLRQQHRLDRKGAIDTFDGHGYLALLHRIRAPRQGEVVYAPAFDRQLEQPVAGSIAIRSGTRLVITEGNYLLSPVRPWNEVRSLLDECWFVDVADDLRRRRLVERHTRFGKSPEGAREWVDQVDEANVRMVIADRERADLVVDLGAR